jgi:hypothetical protein
MDVFQTPFSGESSKPEAATTADPRLQATPDYGTLGPGSDVSAGGPDSVLGTTRLPVNAKRFGPVFAAAIGVLFAVFVGNVGGAHAAWSGVANLLSNRGNVPPSANDLHQIDRMKPQKQAETLLELAVDRNDVAIDQISSRVDRWQGKVQWNSQIATLTTAALNSSDMRVRESGIEVEIAAYGLAKNSASVDYLVRTTRSADHAQKIWALWALGLMGNRGVQTNRVVQVLSSHLNDADEDSRRWAVQGLALAGSTQTIELLLKAMHDDSSATVRESAACSLAEAGMYTREQRFTAVPQLLSYSDDPSLDAQTHAWAFQALHDITRQHLPNDSSAWRSWYESIKVD